MSGLGERGRPGRPTRPPIGALLSAVLLSGALLSCMDATDVELLEITATGAFQGQAYVDLNANRALDSGDQPLADITVVLQPAGTAAAADEAVTDGQGVFTFPEVPVGTYGIGLPAAVLGDSLVSVVNGASAVTVAPGETLQVEVGATYPELTLAEVRSAEPGRRVFTAGIALNARPSPDPVGQVHFESAGSYLRAINVERGAMSIGDSVRLLGRTAVDNGQPVLDQVSRVVLVSVAEIPSIEEVATTEAGDAAGGGLDAALVRIRNAEISDTATVNGDFRFFADDGSGAVEVVLRGFLGLSTSAVRPDTVVRIQQAVGLLTPFDDGSGTLRWRVLPRFGADVVLETKVAEVSVTAAFDPVAAAPTDTVEMEVVVTNAGPLTATGVQVTDTIPGGLAFVSATATSGTYDDAESLWTVGDLAAGASDTLRIRVEVTATPPVTITNRARLIRLLFEVDATSNNSDAATLDVS